MPTCGGDGNESSPCFHRMRIPAVNGHRSSNSESTRTIARGIIERGRVCAKIVTTEDRQAVRILFPVGHPNKVWDFAWRSGRDASWDEFVELSGGVEAIKDRCREVSVGINIQATRTCVCSRMGFQIEQKSRSLKTASPVNCPASRLIFLLTRMK